jgi:hypothetical protein
MFARSSLTTTDILAAFTAEVVELGGEVSDTFHEGRRLFTRSILRRGEEVRPGDRVQGGIALKATGAEVCVYPYVFRQVCRNGAIMAQTLQSQRLENLYQEEPEAALESIRECVRACAAPEVFSDAVIKMRAGRDVQADVALSMVAMMSRFSGASTKIMTQIIDQFFREGDRTQFGLANAVTAVARETRDPEVRWNLEELGGGMLIESTPRRPVNSGRATKRESLSLVGAFD